MKERGRKEMLQEQVKKREVMGWEWGYIWGGGERKHNFIKKFPGFASSSF
jgi:hypothetical protein